MTGHEFKHFVKLCGTQESVARQLGVDSDTLRIRYNEKKVPPLYENAILALVLKECAKWEAIKASLTLYNVTDING